MNTFKNPYTGKEEKARISKDKYEKGNRMFLGLQTWDEEFGYWAPYTDITVNYPRERLSGENCAFVDTSNCPSLEEFLEENGLAYPTGRFAISTWCVFPEYKFDMDEVEKWTKSA